MTTAPARISTWTIDADHSIAEFSVRHLVVDTVKGRFKELSGRLHVDEDDRSRSWVEAQIAAASVDTGLQQRDDHLRSDDFFNAAEFPFITFKSTRVEANGQRRWSVIGELTIRDITREVVLDVEFDGESQGFDGKRRAAFTAETSLNRKDFGLKYNALLESGTIVVADRVKIGLHVALVEE